MLMSHKISIVYYHLVTRSWALYFYTVMLKYSHWLNRSSWHRLMEIIKTIHKSIWHKKTQQNCPNFCWFTYDITNCYKWLTISIHLQIFIAISNLKPSHTEYEMKRNITRLLSLQMSEHVSIIEASKGRE